jgi:hypothetical protein
MNTFLCVVVWWHLVSTASADIYTLIINPDHTTKSTGGHSFAFINDNPCWIFATEMSVAKQINHLVRPGTNRVVIENRSERGRYDLQIVSAPGNKVVVKRNIAVKQQVEFLLPSDVWEPPFYSTKIGDTNLSKRELVADLDQLVMKLTQPNKLEAVRLLMEGQWDWAQHAYNTSEATVREAQEASVQRLAALAPEQGKIANDFEMVAGNNLVLIYSRARAQLDPPCFVVMKAPGKKDVRLPPILLWKKGGRWAVW